MYNTQDPIKVLTIIPITVDKSRGAIVKNRFKTEKNIKQKINNSIYVDFFIISSLPSPYFQL